MSYMKRLFDWFTNTYPDNYQLRLEECPPIKGRGITVYVKIYLPENIDITVMTYIYEDQAYNPEEDMIEVIKRTVVNMMERYKNEKV